MRAKMLTLTALLTAAAGPALAAAPAREDSSGVFVWIFLGICALIVAAQLVPAALMLLGAARGVAKAMHEAGKEKAESKVEAR